MRTKAEDQRTLVLRERVVNGDAKHGHAHEPLEPQKQRLAERVGFQDPREKKRWNASWCLRPATPVTTSAAVTARVPGVRIQPVASTSSLENDGRVIENRKTSKIPRTGQEWTRA